MSFVEVAVAMPVHGLYTYSIPEGETLQMGQVVQVPFGRQKVAGYIVRNLHQKPDFATKPIARVLETEPAFDETQLRFFQWIAQYYVSGLGEVIATALPSAYRAKTKRVFLPHTDGIDALASETHEEGPLLLVLREVIARPGRTRGGIARGLHDELEADKVGRTIDSLVRKGWITVEERQPSTRSGRISTVKLTVAPNAIPVQGGIRMRGVLAVLAEAGGQLDVAEIVAQEGEGARDALRRLEKKGLIERGTREDRSMVGDQGLVDEAPPPPLNPAQENALEAINGLGSHTALLHGVTGSGKTEVYLRATAEVLNRSQQVLVLVPEIALTPQLLGRFRSRFAERIAVLHSGLTSAERLREWRRIRAGEADVAIGARSALFAPFRDLGLIVVDEEHDDSYKQDDGVRYHARDLAVVRGRIANCPVVLGSATPSMETWQNAQEGRYQTLLLPERATPRPLPDIELVDMRGRKGGNPLSTELIQSLKDTIEAGEQAIVLYNRRGYAPVVECSGCGAVYSCPSCGVGSLVYHQRQGRMSCHYCGFRRNFDEDCKGCNTRLSIVGYGTERVEEALTEALPGVPIARMDSDTTQGRGAHARILDRFRQGKDRVLVGTQVVAKGHDFPGVSLAAVVGVDHVLLMPDFRSAERTHALVTQLAGRAGRGETPGRVILQTRHPDHFVFANLTADSDIDAFYTAEARQRQILSHPPFARIVLIRVEGTDLTSAQKAGQDIANKLRATADGQGIQVFGPVLAPLSKTVGRWRFQVVLRGRDVPRFRAWLDAQSKVLSTRPKRGNRLIVDVDARSLL